MVLHPDFRDLLSALADSSAEYLVIGGWAVGVHAEPRFTQDLDLFVGTDDENLLRVVRAFERFGGATSSPSRRRPGTRRVGKGRRGVAGNPLAKD